MISEKTMKTRELLIKHSAAYPSLRAEDIFKFIFQSSFGCEHLVSNESAALEYIKREYAAIPERKQPRVEELDGDYSRVHLSCLSDGLSPETLARLFCLSAKKEEKGEEKLREKLEVALELVGADDEIATVTGKLGASATGKTGSDIRFFDDKGQFEAFIDEIAICLAD